METDRDREAWENFVQHVREDAVRKIDASAAVLSLVPDEVDIKFAVELGLAIMLDKPVIAIATPGQRIPERLRRVADKIVEADIDLEEGQQRLRAALLELGIGGHGG